MKEQTKERVKEKEPQIYRDTETHGCTHKNPIKTENQKPYYVLKQL